MDGKMPAAGPSPASEERRRAAPYDDDDARDGVNAMRDAVAPPQGEEPDHQVPGRGNGGDDGLGTWPVRQNPIPLQNKNQAAHGVSDVREEVAPPQAEHLVLGHGNGGEGGISMPQQPQNRYYLVPEEVFHRGWNKLVDVTCENTQLRRQLAASQEERASLREELRQAKQWALISQAAVALELLAPLHERRRAGLDDGVTPICLLCRLSPATVALRPCEHSCLCSPCSMARRMCPYCHALTTN
ncbi:hypothetical protein C2845_PM14G05840 [Panicum miliaceum]|uniref:RING-type domain-containing protein n=1 Tax=Panicum miliaceum TaxID=4540 RepID=A0A3L6PR10_PANMI|nr:hypothetical protein C2845_PM14G05840 [Panicum miliaceum]